MTTCYNLSHHLQIHCLLISVNRFIEHHLDLDLSILILILGSILNLAIFFIVHSILLHLFPALASRLLTRQESQERRGTAQQRQQERQQQQQEQRQGQGQGQGQKTQGQRQEI